MKKFPQMFLSASLLTALLAANVRAEPLPDKQEPFGDEDPFSVLDT
jgi:hypothetical protein